MILERFAMFDTVKVEIKKEHQWLMVSKTTKFHERQGLEGILRETAKQLLH